MKKEDNQSEKVVKSENSKDVFAKLFDADVVVRKVRKKKNSLKELELLHASTKWCKRPPEPCVDHKGELDKHRHNIRSILQYSNATPFKAYHVDDGYLCSFCELFFEKAADLKSHTINDHSSEYNKFKENATSVFTYVVKLDVTKLCCNICKMEFNTLDDFSLHLQSHDVNLHMDVKNQIVCFKFETDLIRCMYCCQEFSNFKFLLEHMNDHYKNYICEDCNVGFINFRMLLAHVDGQDLTVGEVKCPICDKVFEKHASYKQHKLLSHYGFDLTSHKCTHCDQSFLSDNDLRIHVNEEHNGHHRYICDGCKKVYPEKQLLIAHAKRVHLHEEKHFKCEICGRSYYDKQQLKAHMLRHCDPPKFQCDTCAKMFKTKETLVTHIRTHSLKGNHKCFSCEETFFRKSFLEDHTRQVHLKEVRVKCQYCVKCFYESQLKTHIAKRHSELITYKCDVCFLACKSKKTLIQHMGTHDNFKQLAKKYECLACEKVFRQKIYLTKHTQRVHLLEKKFVCDQCGRKFADTTTLKNHLATHSNAALFQCFACPRTFKTKKTMMNHARNHMDERKVKCSICHHGFIYPYLLKEHLKQVHKVIQ